MPTSHRAQQTRTALLTWYFIQQSGSVKKEITHLTGAVPLPPATRDGQAMAVGQPAG
jgi:hypothetical protein